MERTTDASVGNREKSKEERIGPRSFNERVAQFFLVDEVDSATGGAANASAQITSR
jgi:hypothetical protein